MKKLYLFDMDGTLTPARRNIEKSTIDILLKTLLDSKSENHISIVTGSDLNYLVEQCGELFSRISSLDNDIKQRVKLFPCNGTKQYHFAEDGISYKLIKNLDIKEKIGKENYNYLVRLIFQIQLRALGMNGLIGNIPVTGNFISYRGSMINWCPIGRDSSPELRETFISFDKINYLWLII